MCHVPRSLADKGQYDKVPPTKATTIRKIFFLVIYSFTLIIFFSFRLRNNAANDTEYKVQWQYERWGTKGYCLEKKQKDSIFLEELGRVTTKLSITGIS